MVTIESKRWDEIPNGLEQKARLEQFGRNSDWLEEHRAELSAKYPDEFVFVHEGAVVAHGPDLFQTVRELHAAGYADTPVANWFFSSKPVILIV